MPSETIAIAARDRRLARIRRLSRILAVACVATSVLLVIAVLFYWLTTPTQELLFTQASLVIAKAQTGELGLTIRLMAFLISMVPLGALVYGLMQARQCFAAFAAGRIFSPETAGWLRNFAVAVTASALLKPFAGAALSVLLSWHGSSSKAVVFNVSSEMVLGLIFGGTVALIAWVMGEAMTIADENAQFI